MNDPASHPFQRLPGRLLLSRLHGQPEIFHSIQGEGASMGLPSVFVRTSLCNLHCTWCDTDYTWNWQGTRFRHDKDAVPGYQKYDPAEWVTDTSVETAAALIRAFSCANVVLTGGEPMLQQESLVLLANLLRNTGPDFRFEVETNGTLMPTPAFDAAVDQYNVSPKLNNSGNASKLREKPEVYRFFAASAKAYFKFVVAGPEDEAEVSALADAYGLNPSRVFLMPQAPDRLSLDRLRGWVVDLCKKHGYRYSHRLHVEIWGDQKGV